MKPGLVAVTILLAARTAAAAEPKPPGDKPELINPARYRILVRLDKRIIDQVREDIAEEVRNVLDERARRLDLSKAEVRTGADDALAAYRAELDAVRKARDAERAALARGDAAEAEKWRRLSIERAREALNLARRIDRIEAALLALSLRNWREARDKEAAVARKALERLNVMLQDIRAEENRRETAPAPLPRE